jgi:hypothetical protein
VFVDVKADLEKAKRLVVDSKVDYPAACNAMETLLIHEGDHRSPASNTSYYVNSPFSYFCSPGQGWQCPIDHHRTAAGALATPDALSSLLPL